MKTNVVFFCLEPKLCDLVAKTFASQLDMYYLNSTELFKFDHIPHTIDEFLTKYGEREVRKLESGTISYSASFFNTAICVDSGVVKLKKNIDVLKQKCYVIYIKLPTKYCKTALNDAIYENLIIKKFYNINEKQLELRADKMLNNADIVVSGYRKSALKVCSEVVRSFKLILEKSAK